MRLIVVEKNGKGKIELTQDELQKIVTDAYQEGLAQSRVECIPVYTTPFYPTNSPYKLEITCKESTANGNIN